MIRDTCAGAEEFKTPSLVAFIGGAEQTVLAIKNFLTAHQAELQATNPIKHLPSEIKRCTNVVSILPNAAGICHLSGAIREERSEEWVVQRRRFISLETRSLLSNDHFVVLAAVH